MKHQSLLSEIKSLGIMLSLGLALASCTKDDVAQNPAKPNEEGNKNLTTFVAGDEAKTRTSLDYNSSDFSWEAGDYIYVKDDDGVLQKSSNAPTQKVASFRYRVPGKFGASASYKVYYLGKNSNGSQVTISTNQTQTAPDNTEHFGTAGDYGTATATGSVGGKIFSFQLEHHPAYLVFQPYTSNTILQSCSLTKVEVTSDNDIAETYTVNTSTGALTGSAGSKQIVLTTSGSSSNPNGFSLSNSSASVSANGAYMVIKPGTHTLRVRYWVKDAATNVEGTITKIYPSTAYASNTYYDMTASLDVNYDGDHYYMWDAQQQYWYGYEWTKNLGAGVGQPTLNYGLPNATTSSNYPQSNTDSRYYHEGGGSGRFDATQSCATLPNANELSWYCMYGDPRWDADELWTTMGHLYKGGMWFKKKSVLLTEHHYDTEKSADGSTDMRTTWNIYDNSSSSINSGLPSAADAGKYFYLPALGSYYSGQLRYVGDHGYYWSSSAYSEDSYHAYGLNFNSGGVSVDNLFSRSNGYRVGGFE
jgi:putative lipoprotein